MKTVEETRRELFEKYFINADFSKDEFGFYIYWDVEAGFKGFNAALDAIVIQLPESCKMTTEELNEGYDAGFLKWEILDSINSLNLGIKVK